MFRRKLCQWFLASCLCGAGVLGCFIQVRADPATASGDVANISIGTNDSMTGSSLGLKLPPNLTQDAADDDEEEEEEGNAPAVPATQPAPPAAMDKSLATVKRNVDKPRLGPQLGAGVASWYGPRFQGRRTASGEKFDRYALTAAHKTLPLGSRVVVSNPRTGKQVVVRINDRGPYIGNRVLDLSEAAAHALGLKASGHGWVVMNAALPPQQGSDTADHAAAVQADSPQLPAVTKQTQDTPTAKTAAPRQAASGMTADP